MNCITYDFDGHPCYGYLIAPYTVIILTYAGGKPYTMFTNKIQFQ
jgi:hypothetical protein